MPEIPYPDPPLADGTVALRPWRDADLGDLVAACQDPEIGHWTAVPYPYGEADALRFLACIEPERRAGRELALAVVEPAQGALLGSCGLARFDWDDRKAEIGYWIAAPARGRSAGSRAAGMLARRGISELGLERVELLANPANEPSQRLAVRAGFVREGLLHSYRRRKGRREDLVMFSLVAEDAGLR